MSQQEMRGILPPINPQDCFKLLPQLVMEREHIDLWSMTQDEMRDNYPLLSTYVFFMSLDYLNNISDGTLAQMINLTAEKFSYDSAKLVYGPTIKDIYRATGTPVPTLRLAENILPQVKIIERSDIQSEPITSIFLTQHYVDESFIHPAETLGLTIQLLSRVKDHFNFPLLYEQVQQKRAEELEYQFLQQIPKEAMSPRQAKLANTYSREYVFAQSHSHFPAWIPTYNN